MDILQNDTRGIELTLEFVEKSDKDIETIKTLNKLGLETGDILVVFGGYATEALCGGDITRPHGDIDIHFILTGKVSKDDLFTRIDSILGQEKILWEIKKINPNKVEYLEDAEDKEFFNRRKVEIYINSPDEVNVEYSKRKLIKSQGVAIEICVRDLQQLVKHKLQKFYELRNGVDTTKDRHSSKSDFFDLKRLLELEELDLDKLKGNLPQEYEYILTLMSV